MLVSHKAKFIYLKTFKTAGTSVEQALESACRPFGSPADGSYYNGPEGIVAERGGRREGNPYRSHADARLVRHQLGKPIWNSYTKVAAVRDPYEKAVSMFWHQHTRHGLIPEPGEPLSAIAAFQDWICGGARLPRDIFRVSIKGEVFLDFAIRHERIETDLAAFCGQVGIPVAPLRRFHGELRQLDLDHRAYYNSATAERVADHYALDFQAFGYDVDDWQPRQERQHSRSAA